MVALSDIRFLAKDAAGRLKGIAGSTITVALATLAQGLQKAGDITIRANGSVPRTVSVGNSGGGAVTLGVSGDIAATGDAGVDGDLTVGGYVEAGNLFSIDAISAAGDIVLKNNGSTHRITLTGNPTGNRVITFPDSDYTIGSGGSGLPYIGSYTNAALHALPAPTSPVSAYCSDLGGVAGGGVFGVFVYWSMAGLWLRFSNDSPF